MTFYIKNEIQDSLKPMFEEAKRKGLWFFCRYQELWFSPEELREEQINGRFRWGTANWELRDPKERLEQLKKEAESSLIHIYEFERRLK